MTTTPRIGMATLEVTNVAKARDDMVRVTLSDHADGTISLLTSRDNQPDVGAKYQATFTPLAAT